MNCFPIQSIVTDRTIHALMMQPNEGQDHRIVSPDSDGPIVFQHGVGLNDTMLGFSCISPRLVRSQIRRWAVRACHMSRTLTGYSRTQKLLSGVITIRQNLIHRIIIPGSAGLGSAYGRL